MRKTILSLAALTSIMAPLAACSTVVETVRGPELAPVGYPAPLDQFNWAPRTVEWELNLPVPS